jgi:hypothetical protein
VSSEDIAKGARWSIEIAKELESSNYGIICITRDNLTSLWVNFEAGALSKEMGNSFVTPFLFDLTSSEVQGPLAQFQATGNDKEEIQKMLTAINDRLGEQHLDKGALEDAFEKRWGALKNKLAEIEHEEKGKPTPPKRSTEEMVEEVVELVSAMQRDKLTPTDAAFAELIRQLTVQQEYINEIARPRPLGGDAKPSSNALRDRAVPAIKPAVNPTFPRNREKL